MTAKVYVDVLAVFSREGELIPTAFVWEDGRKYAIDKVSKPERCASRKAGGTGYRYTCQVGGKICHLTYEENYRWFMERKQIQKVVLTPPLLFDIIGNMVAMT